MLNSQFLDGGPVFSIFQKSNMEVVQASLNSSLRAWQLLLSSMAGCWLLAQIMNQRQHRQPLHVSHGSNREGIVCTCPCLCLTSSKIIPSCSPCHGSLSICLRGCCWRRGGSMPGMCPQLLQTSPLLLQSTAQYLPLCCAAAFIGTSKRQGRVLLTFQIPSADWN